MDFRLQGACRGSAVRHRTGMDHLLTARPARVAGSRRLILVARE
jgi:hypothetical protein